MRYGTILGLPCLLLMPTLCDGAGAVPAEPSRGRQDEAAIRIQTRGGRIRRSDSLRDKPVCEVTLDWDSASKDVLAELRALPHLRKVTIDGGSDENLPELEPLTSLEELVIHGRRCTDAGVGFLKSMTKLRKLSLARTKVTCECLAYAAQNPNLEELDLSATGVDDVGFDRIKDFAHLRKVNLSYTKLSDKGISHLKSLPELEVIELRDLALTDESLRNVKSLARLNALYLGGTQVTNDGIGQLKALTSLERLDLSDTETSDVGLQRLKEFRSLRELDLAGCFKVTDAGLDSLAALHELEALNLSFTRVTDAGIAKIAKCRKLRVLAVSLLGDRNPELDRLQKDMPNLKVLRLAQGKKKG